MKLSALTLSLLLLACTPPEPPPSDVDQDGDGFTEDEDCDDTDPQIFPGQLEVCNERDDDCDGVIDEGTLDTFYRDADHDGYGDPSFPLQGCIPPPGFSALGGDCDDDAATGAEINPGVPEIPCNEIDEDCDAQTHDNQDLDGDGDGCLTDCDDNNPEIHSGLAEDCTNGVDDNCNGQIDANEDADGDGFGGCGEDCKDDDPGISPGAFEVLGDSVDNDCDGLVDEVETCPCPSATLADAIGLCDPRFLISQSLVTTEAAPDESWGITAGTADNWGNSDLDPRDGCDQAVLTSGRILDTCAGVGDNPYFEISGSCGVHVDPAPNGPNGVQICDLIQYRLELKAPSNALGFSFEFAFLSSEYPEWVNAGFNDTFYALLQAPSTNSGAVTNITFDPSNNEIEVDNSFFQQPGYTLNLSNTAYACDAGSTGWLKTTWPVDPNEEFVLTFSIHDEGDAIVDSLVLINQFEWHPNPVPAGTDHN